jgi:hypothetical protein
MLWVKKQRHRTVIVVPYACRDVCHQGQKRGLGKGGNEQGKVSVFMYVSVPVSVCLVDS